MMRAFSGRPPPVSAARWVRSSFPRTVRSAPARPSGDEGAARSTGRASRNSCPRRGGWGSSTVPPATTARRPTSRRISRSPVLIVSGSSRLMTAAPEPARTDCPISRMRAGKAPLPTCRWNAPRSRRGSSRLRTVRRSAMNRVVVRHSSGRPNIAPLGTSPLSRPTRFSATRAPGSIRSWDCSWLWTLRTLA